jgi:hypothetical protein
VTLTEVEAAPAALVKNRQRSHPETPRRVKKKSQCPVPGLLLVGSGGRTIPLGCGRNSCPTCGPRKADVLRAMLGALALTHTPDGVLVLTTQNPRDAYDPGKFTKSMEQVVRALRKRWPELEYLGFIEFTTGLASTSGGRRRIHTHVFLRGCSDLIEAQAIASRVWCSRMAGASRKRQTVEEIRTPEAMFKYLASHHLKVEQAPPSDWWGKRVRPSRGWWPERPVSEWRAEGEALVSLERRVWRARRDLGPLATASMVDDLVAEYESGSAGPWALWRTHTTERGTVVLVGPWVPSGRGFS